MAGTWDDCLLHFGRWYPKEPLSDLNTGRWDCLKPKPVPLLRALFPTCPPLTLPHTKADMKVLC